MNYAALFPGQGAQFAGMAIALRDDFPWTREIYEEASDALHEDLLKLCLEGPEDKLQLTHNAQPAILTTSFAWFQVLKRTLDFAPRCGAGHSLGEYSALVAAEALPLMEAVKLVRRRGELMQKAVPEGKGKMAAILGLSDDAVGRLCAKATEGDDSLVVPANFNAPAQVVIAGHATAVERAEKLALGDEFGAKKVVPLKVSAPFHCPLMRPAADGLWLHLERAPWKTKRQFAIAHNLDAGLREEGDVSALLRDQIDHPVRWTGCMQALEGAGVLLYIEMGPGRVLSGLGKRIVSEGSFVSVESASDVKKLESLLKSPQRGK